MLNRISITGGLRGGWYKIPGESAGQLEIRGNKMLDVETKDDRCGMEAGSSLGNIEVIAVIITFWTTCCAAQ